MTDLTDGLIYLRHFIPNNNLELSAVLLNGNYTLCSLQTRFVGLGIIL